MKLLIVIPTCNEALTIAQVLQGVLAIHIPELQKEIIVVDDGSTDNTVAIARSKGVHVAEHLINRGLGGALGTGLEAALRAGADLMVTFDGDGQHAPEDILAVIQPILNRQADVVIGSRMLAGDGMPLARRMANHIANLITFVLFGIRTTDSQSGLRAFSRFAAEQIQIIANTYEVSSEIFGEIKRHHLKLAEVPIRTIYTQYSLSKGQGFAMGIRTLFRMLLHITGRQS